MKLISFAIASIVDVNTGIARPHSVNGIDTFYAERRGREIRSRSLLSFFSWLRDAVTGLVERSRVRAENRRQIAELSALSDRSLRDIGLHRADIDAVQSGLILLDDLRRQRHLRAGQNLRLVQTGQLGLPRASMNDPAPKRERCA